ncbi:MAG: Gfo/Idh/MocA family oxidoreductase [Candidatus Glassbacteria bacterium]|nr:Gfo/Idh/MocA family oxidoreductase [Candidatus Glassbacteria bacterium]
MSNRRKFITDLGAGAVSGLALAAVAQAQGASAPEPDFGSGKRVRVGIIGAENSHTIGFGQMFNVEKKFPGVEVVAVWGETDEFARNAAEKGSIPRIVKQQEELMGMIDALIVDHRHARYHVEAARPFVGAGIPTFVDKPFCYRVSEGRELVELAEERKTPITSLSSVAYGPGIDDMAAQVAGLEDPGPIVITGPAGINSKYGGIFFYGIHTVERLFKVFGDDAEAVRATRHGPHTTFQVEFTSGKLATIILGRQWQVFRVVQEGMLELKPRFESEDSLYMYAAIVRMFQTGEEPRTHESILRSIAALEAMERSVLSERWELLLV